MYYWQIARGIHALIQLALITDNTGARSRIKSDTPSTYVANPSLTRRSFKREPRESLIIVQNTKLHTYKRILYKDRNINWATHK